MEQIEQINNSWDGELSAKLKKISEKFTIKRYSNVSPNGFIPVPKDNINYKDDKNASILYKGIEVAVVFLALNENEEESFSTISDSVNSGRIKPSKNLICVISKNGQSFYELNSNPNEESSLAKFTEFDLSEPFYKLSRITIEDFVDRIYKSNPDASYLICSDINLFKDNYFLPRIKELSKDIKSQNRIISWAQKTELSFNSQENTIELPDESEHYLYKALLNPERKVDSFCRYISLSGLFRMLNNKTVSLTGLVGMNDRSESDYAKNYILELSKKETGKTQQIPFIDELNISNSNQKGIISDGNQYYILSCSDVSLYDDLMMWKMYGNDAKGACIKYKIDQNALNDTNSMFAFISYADKSYQHLELNFIYSLLKTDFDGIKIKLNYFDIWEHFFKPHEYYREKEVRLLLKQIPTKETRWILPENGIMTPIIEFSINKNDNPRHLPIFPLIMTDIMLGPKVENADFVKNQIEQMIAIHKTLDNRHNCKVVLTSIKTYR